MRKKRKILLIVVPIVAIICLVVYYLSNHNIPVMEPAGTIADKEKHLMIIALLLSAIVVVPVFSLTIAIAVRYRETNTKARYEPDWDHSRTLESIWWGVPIAIIVVLSVITWRSTYALNPYKLIASNKPTINVEVVSLDWKWLFIYPGLGAASVNQLALPINQPVHFYLTSDTVMNSFWIPALGGQIYAMPGMTTQLNLEANKYGSFYGSSANISGKGFAGMNFRADSMTESAFNAWIKHAQASNMSLNDASYVRLAKPSENNPVTYYKNPQTGLYQAIVDQYMMPGASLSKSATSSMGMGESN